MERVNLTDRISLYHKTNLKYVLGSSKTLPMKDESICNILKNILDEYKIAEPQSEPKEVWLDREWNKPKPIKKRNDIFAC